MNEENKKNTKVSVESLGEVELKFISISDYKKFLNMFSMEMSEKDFVVRAIYNQLLRPEIELKELITIPETDLKEIISAFIKKEQNIFEFFEDTGNLYLDFKQSISIYNIKTTGQLRKTLIPIIKSAQEQITSFEKDYSQIIQQSLIGTSYFQDSLVQLADYSRQLADSQQIIADAVSPVIDQLHSAAKTITELLRPQIEIWERWSEEHQWLLDSYARYWENFYEEYDIAESQAVEVLQRYKWFITPSIPISIVFQVITLDKDEGRQDKAINNLFINYFAENNWKNLYLMVTSWNNNPLFEKRRKILSDCVDSIKLCDTKKINIVNIVLPTLITQIDGVVSDYLIAKGIAWDRDYDDWIDGKTGKVKKVGRKSQLQKNMPDVMTTPLDELARGIFLNILFQRSQKGKPLATPFNFNRHKIIHGEITRYGRKDYLVRAFMILDMFAHF